jgi:hypothetical protein
LAHGVAGFDDLIEWLYYSAKPNAPGLLQKSITAAKELIDAGDAAVDIRAGLSKMSKGAIIMLRRQLDDLEKMQVSKEIIGQTS